VDTGLDSRSGDHVRRRDGENGSRPSIEVDQSLVAAAEQLTAPRLALATLVSTKAFGEDPPMEPTVNRLCRRALLFLLGVYAYCPNGAMASEFTNTRVHFLLTNAQNLRLELDNVEAVIALDQWGAAAPSNEAAGAAPDKELSKDRVIPVGFFRTEFMAANQADGNIVQMTLGLQGGYTFDSGIKIVGWTGGTFWGIAHSGGSSTWYEDPYWYLCVGGSAGFREWIEAKAFVGFVVDPSNNYTFDNLETTLSSPKLGLFSLVGYNIGDAQASYLETGYQQVLQAIFNNTEGLGRVKLAYSKRFQYEITGEFAKGDFQNLPIPRANFMIKPDDSAVLRWEDINPFAFVDLGGGVAIGTVPDAVRYGFLQAGARMINNKTDGINAVFFVRGSTTYSRLEEQRLYGVGVGFMGSTPMFFTQALVGYRDFETVDRFGAPTNFVFSVTVGGKLQQPTK